jgi:hypothetical protein
VLFVKIFLHLFYIMEISKDINDYIPELIKILNIRDDWLNLKELQTKKLVINNKYITDVVYSSSLTDDQKISTLQTYFGDKHELANEVVNAIKEKPIVYDFSGVAPAPSASADDAVSPTGAPADDSAEDGNHRRNISSDKDKTRSLIIELDNATIDDTNKEEVIRMLESTPDMLEFIGENLVLVHSYHSRASQFVTKDEKICDKSRKVVNFLQKYYSSQQIQKEVSLTNKLKTKCSRSVSPTKLMSPDELMSDDIQPKKIVLANVSHVLGGSKSRHIRRHKHNRKSHRKHPRKTRRGRGRGRGRTHKSKSKSKRQILARKYKKNTYKRCT